MPSVTFTRSLVGKSGRYEEGQTYELSDEDAARYRRAGYLADSPAPRWDNPDRQVRPSRGAKRDTWVAYAARHGRPGVDYGSMTKGDIIDELGDEIRGEGD